MKKTILIGVVMLGFLNGCAERVEKYFISLEERPQEPKVRNYVIEQIKFQGGDKDVILAGELTYPKGDGPFPALVLITGYGSQEKPFDRDYDLGEWVGHKSYLVFSDLMTQKGYAVLRYDNRGVRESSGNWREATDPMYASDAASAMKWLKENSGLKLSKVGYVGHSQGGIKAPMASKIENADFLVLLAGGVESTAETIITGIQQKANDLNVSQYEKDKMLKELKDILALMRQSNNRHEAIEKIKAYALKKGTSDKQAKEIAENYAQAVTFESLDRNWEEIIKGLSIPILSIYGGKDKLVFADTNVQRNKAVLIHPKSKVKLFPNMNHMLQPAKKGGIDEYWEIKTTFDESVSDYINIWIKETVL